MKLCKDCEFVKTIKDMDRNGQVITMFFCENSECCDPVSGEILPCGIARKEPLFCGFNAKHFKKKEEKPEPQVIQLVQS